MSENQVVCHKKGKIYFKGELINQLIKTGFDVKMCYTKDEIDDFMIPVASADDISWFRVFKMAFRIQKQAPELLVSQKIELPGE